MMWLLTCCFVTVLLEVSASERCRNGVWTEYYNSDKPTKIGDFETIPKLRRFYSEHLCEKPFQIDVRVSGSTKPYQFFGQKVKANTDIGFVCLNKQQADGKCLDYEVRYCCPEVTCPGDMWTPFFNRDQPYGECDCETLPLLRLKYGDMICKSPQAIDVRVVDTGLYYTTEGQKVKVSLEDGFRCDNKDNDEPCLDYKVRFCCPTPQEPVCQLSGWTPFLDSDDPGWLGDFETIANLRLTYPEIICDQPTTVDARVVSTHQSYLSRMQNIEIDPSTGFVCYNVGQRCEDYEVRFCCPKEVIPPACPDGKWTFFYDVDDPTLYGDYETLNVIRSQFGDEVCDDVIAVDARVRATGESHVMRGQNVVIGRDVGFFCENVGQQCEDYAVRFCCPSDCNVCADGYWTQFFDTDDPDGEGDLETHSKLVASFPRLICNNPTKTEARLLNGEHYTSADQVVDLTDGFACYNNDNGGSCCDYKVRFCCPEQVSGCELPRLIPNGIISPEPQEPFLPGDNYQYECDPNFLLVGSTFIECQDDFSWDPLNDQRCEPIGCGLPPNATSYFPDVGPYLPEDIVTYTCDDDLQLVGFSTLICGMNGTWSQPYPKCRRKGDTFVAFLIDTTSSMTFEIEAVRLWVMSCIYASTEQCGIKPTGGFLVSPFNDSDTGPLLGPLSPYATLVALTDTAASGGGDCPELTFTAIRDTLNRIPDANSGCKIFIFTDATAKDFHLESQVKSAIAQKGCQVIEVLTGCCLPVCDVPKCSSPDTHYCKNAVVDMQGNLILPPIEDPIDGTLFSLSFDSRGRIFLLDKPTSVEEIFGFIKDELSLGFCPTTLYAGPAPEGYTNARHCTMMGGCWDKSLFRCFCKTTGNECPRLKIPDCSTNEATTQYPYPGKCDKYFLCSEGVMSVEICVQGTVFHEKSCRPKKDVPSPCGDIGSGEC